MSHTHRVLIVEDDYAFRWSLAMRCQRRRIDADIAETVREAHELISRPSDGDGQGSAGHEHDLQAGRRGRGDRRGAALHVEHVSP